MEEGDGILEALYDEQGDDLEDVDMVDVEEGEFIENDDVGDNVIIETKKDDTLEKSQSEDSKRKANKKKKKKKKKNRHKSGGGGPGPNMDINRFVLDTCRRLKEKKSYMVYTAVGCLGMSALSDLVKEVDVIQSCGGQMTADGKRQRTGGGVLWSIIKAREPNAYREIMKRAKEFEKQFKQQNIRQAQARDREAFSGGPASEDSTISPATLQDDAEVKRQSVKDRIRVPVSYEDILGGPKDETG